MAVRRVLNEKKLRAELEEAGKALRHSHRYIARRGEIPLTEYAGAMRKEISDVKPGSLGDAWLRNQRGLLAANRASEIVLDLGPGRLGRTLHESMRIEPVEIGVETEKRHDSESQAQRPRRL